MTSDKLYTVRISARVRSYLEGSGAYQNADDYREAGDGDEAALAARILDEAPADRYGVAKVMCSLPEVGIIADWADMMETSARDDARFDNPDMMGELNAARALTKQVSAYGQWEYYTRDGKNFKAWVPVSA